MGAEHGHVIDGGEVPGRGGAFPRDPKISTPAKQCTQADMLELGAKVCGEMLAHYAARPDHTLMKQVSSQ